MVFVLVAVVVWISGVVFGFYFNTFVKRICWLNKVNVLRFSKFSSTYKNQINSE